MKRSTARSPFPWFGGKQQMADHILALVPDHNVYVEVCGGGASVLLSFLLMAFPGAGLIAWVWMIGAYALLSGMLLLILAFKLRHLATPGRQQPRPRTAG